jgi:quinolinate synthase
MFHYGHSWPSANYFNSNMMVSNFVVVNFTSDSANVLFYDKRAQGKDADALCSLRFMYHSNKFKTTLERKQVTPKILLVILDNCVG